MQQIRDQILDRANVFTKRQWCGTAKKHVTDVAGAVIGEAGDTLVGGDLAQHVTEAVVDVGGGQVLRVFDRAADEAGAVEGDAGGLALAVECVGNRFAAGGGAGQATVAVGGGGTCGGVSVNGTASVQRRRAHKHPGGRAGALA